ncbi:uncharacterized protein LOC111615679 [Centruroides sculpturatus]|uniref:uncharacterized protein LOC111615679 n=1 Tax=Centruroides sculpturatus TaxID=218467 RepID=UPI000C6E5212|nr:uncharacterized protein LOC111615679 [Centruroides sculpturatus]
MPLGGQQKTCDLSFKLSFKNAAITVAIIFFKKKLSNMISGRAQNNIVYRPSENNEFNTRGISVYPEITGFDYSNPTIETTLEILDKPPSYEEIMTLSKSMLIKIYSYNEGRPDTANTNTDTDIFYRYFP